MMDDGITPQPNVEHHLPLRGLDITITLERNLGTVRLIGRDLTPEGMAAMLDIIRSAVTT